MVRAIRALGQCRGRELVPAKGHSILKKKIQACAAPRFRTNPSALWTICIETRNVALKNHSTNLRWHRQYISQTARNRPTTNTLHLLTMQNRLLKNQLIAAVLLLPIAAYLVAQDAKPPAVPAPANPKTTPAEFLAKITTDSAEVRNAGQVTLSYADVVQKILPSVVSISTYSKKAPNRRGGLPFGPGDLEQLPPMLREWLERQGGNPVPETPQGRQRPRQTGLGSGVILTADGYIMTNNHVVQDADELKVKVGKSSREYTAKVIGTDPSTDVALIKIEGENLPHATMGDSGKLRVGDVVLAVGSPMGLDQSVTQGIVSAMGRSDVGIINRGGTGSYEDFIQTDAAINPGNSGGPLVDGLGRVIGINTAIETQSGMFSGIGLAIPINMAVSVVSDLLDDGKVERGYIGIRMDDKPVDPSVAEFLGLNDQSGVTVISVVPNSPADKAGFQAGDVITSVNSEKTEEYTKLRLYISSQRPGSVVKFGVARFNVATRKAQTMELSATLERLPSEKVLASMQNPGSGSSQGSAPKPDSFLKGVQVEPLNAENRKENNIPDDVEGLYVTSVAEDSPSAKRGLQEGDVITMVNNSPVKNVAEARSRKGEPGEAAHITYFREGGYNRFVVTN
jgi:serine protease Do